MNSLKATLKLQLQPQIGPRQTQIMSIQMAMAYLMAGKWPMASTQTTVATLTVMPTMTV